MVTPLSHSNRLLERSVHRFALAVAAIVALSVPVGYWFVAYQDFSDALDFKAKVKASALSGLIATSPDVWMFAENRLQGLVSRVPVPLGKELVEVLDQDGAVIASAGSRQAEPVLKRTAPLYDADRKVGQIVVSGSMRALYTNAAMCALLGFMFSAVAYLFVKKLPLKALKAATDAMYQEKERAETTLHSIGDAVVTTDADGRIDYLNPVAEQLLGYSLEQARGRQVADVIRLYNADGGELIECSLYRALKTNAIVACEGHSEIRRADSGTTVAVEERAAPINDRDGAVSGGVVILRDVSIAREFVQRRSWEATHDPLTGLFNRREFERRVQLELADARTTGRSHVLCYMDLDGFKLVNDSCGHAAGDELLIELTKLMKARIRDTDTLARLGGDEFGLLLVGCEEMRGQLIAAEFLAAVNEFHFSFGLKGFKVGVSIGLTVMSGKHSHVAEVVGEADCACYWAKEQGKGRIVTFAVTDMNLAARRSETGWVARINDAFKDNRFVLFHQDYRKLNASAGHSAHLEVLLRMIGESGEVIVPGRFLPAAERYNLMPAIDRWVIHEIFSRYHGLAAQRGERALTCAINLSGASINAAGMLDFIREQARHYKLRPGAVCFELTETVAVNNLQVAGEFIRGCNALGFQFALDDFGVGTSSFGYLKNLPVDYLKIDGSFVKNIEHDSIDETMVETINRIGHILGKQTIAEYAENEAIIGKLGELGVDFAQGYGICMPKPLFI